MHKTCIILYMYKFLPYMTNDGSVGLFDEGVNDIYHSAFGALTEAFEKFINPADILLSKLNENSELNVLDICYGIGYNTKALLQKILDAKICFNKINIDCVDMNKDLICLSPFIKSKISATEKFLFKNKLYKNILGYDETKNILLNYKKNKTSYKISKNVNLFILKNLIENFGYEFLDDSQKNILAKSENFVFFDKALIKYSEFLVKNGVELYQKKNKLAFVHNIYYKYITKRYNIGPYNNISIAFYPQDIRKYLNLSSDKQYDLILLDGFTPSKCPCIWTQDIFEYLYKLTKDNGLIVTYNKSAPVRNAMLLAGYYIGNTIDDTGKVIGTVASKNKYNIINKLTDKDFGLLNTKAGIPYRDYDLSLDNDTIISNRKHKIETSDKMSSSKYLKEFANEI